MKMKKILFSLGILGLALTSCNDFLEEENLSNETAESFYVTAEGFESLVNANYADLKIIYGQNPWLYAAGTDMYAAGRDPEPPGLSEYTLLTPSEGEVAHLYDNAYEAIQHANIALHYADITEQTSTLNNRIGEIKFLRANAYFLLVQTYGGVSLVTDYIQEPVLEFERNSAEEVYAFIINELEEALELVPESGTYNGRVTKRVVRNLLAKVYLTRGYEDFGSANDFSTAASLADQVIGGQTLDIDYADLWVPGNELNSEVIFSVQFDPSSINVQAGKYGNRQANFFGPYMGGSEVAGDAPRRTYVLCVTQYALDVFEEGDERYEATFMTEVFERYYDYYDVPKSDHDDLTVSTYYAPQWASSTADTIAYRAIHPDADIRVYGTYNAIDGDVQNNFELIPVKKFDDPDAVFDTDNVGTSGRDLILSRLGETYLIAAEAYLQAGQPGTGLLRLNEVRRRAGVADALLSEFDIDYILDERARELLGEYHRWFDLKRTGKLVERAVLYHPRINSAANFQGNNGELKILRPIPQTAIDLNQNKDFPQNPAYE